MAFVCRHCVGFLHQKLSHSVAIALSTFCFSAWTEALSWWKLFESPVPTQWWHLGALLLILPATIQKIVYYHFHFTGFLFKVWEVKCLLRVAEPGPKLLFFSLCFLVRTWSWEASHGALLCLSKAHLERCLSFSGLFVFPGFHHSLNFGPFSKWQQVLRGQEGREKGQIETCLWRLVLFGPLVKPGQKVG